MEYPNGFTPIDNDWLESKARSKRTSHRERVLATLQRATWGWQLEWATLSYGEIVTATGLSRPEVGRAIKQLSDDKIIDKRRGSHISGTSHTSATIPPNKYRVNKHLRRSKSYKNSRDVVTKRVTIRWTNIAQAVWLELSFSKFWKAYPKHRHVNKKGAKKSWVKIRLSVNSAKKIIKAVKAQSKSEQWIKDSGQYVPHPTTWLNQERWDDAVETKPTQKW